MAEVSSPVEVLRAAADRLDQLADAAAPGPWEADLREVHDSIGNGIATESDFGDLAEADADWIAMLGPQVAPALSAWLRAEADTAQVSDQTWANFRPTWRDDWSPEDPPPDWSETSRVAALEAMHRHPLAFARMVLGLPAVSDTTGEGQ